MQISLEIIVIGAITGLAYAALATGLVLIYRATRVVNFAHGQLGAFGAAILARFVLDWEWNYFLTFALVIVVGAVLGGLVELGVIRRLFDAPRLILLVATIGVSQVLFFAQAILPGIENVGPYPKAFDRAIQLGDVTLRGEHFMVIAFVPAAVAGLALFLSRTPEGRALRGAAENAEAAQLAGVSIKRLSTLVWILAAVLATATAVLINPLRGVIVGRAQAALGPALMLRALSAGMFGRLVSLPWALAGGVIIGVVEALFFLNTSNPGIVDMVLFVALLVLVLVRGRDVMDEEGGSFAFTPKARPVPRRLREHPVVRRLPQVGAGAALAIGVLLPVLVPSASQTFLFSRTMLFAMVGVSLTILIGWGGQLSLGQFAFVGVGAMTTVGLDATGVPFFPAVVFATAAGVFAALLVGVPALRVRGLFLAITTLGFAVAASSYILPHEVFLGDSSFAILRRGSWWLFDLESQRTYYYVCLAALVFTVYAAVRLRRSGIGRTLIAVRENEPRAAAFTVSPTTAKLTAFAISGGIAALAGALLGGLLVQIEAELFGPEQSLRVMAMTIIGGLGSITGAVLGALYVVGLPALIQDSPEVALLTSGVGLLVLLLYFPGGLVQLLYNFRDSLFGYLDRRLVARPEEEVASPPVPAAGNEHREVSVGAVLAERADPSIPALSTSGVTVRFGGLVAVDDVSIEARTGEVVGLIGSNGAGKSTLMNVVSGFIEPQEGGVDVYGVDVTRLSPADRAKLGLGRVFQDARLFPDLTVREAVQVALEARERSEVVPSLLGLPPSLRAERRKEGEATELVAFLGLTTYADTFIAHLSTGTRRIAELACLLALRPSVLLLDEPTAGVAQRETEAFEPLIKRVQAELGATVVVIEHDMPLVMALSDRVYCLSSGEVIAEGPPDAVRNEPAVIAAYLGTDERAIQRSDRRGEQGAYRGRPVRSAVGGRLAELSKAELLDLAARAEVRGRSRMRKAELIDALEAADA